MNVVAIIQVRSASTRLPGKCMLKIFGKTILEHIILRVSGAKKVQKICVATTQNQEDDIIERIVKKYNVTYDISFGDNFFPEKEYKGVKYQAGNYESLVIKLGSGEGQNWWCVLFPPLCLLDENKNLENAEYELYASKIINKFK